MHPVVMVAIAIDDSGQRGERQVETIERMREQNRVALGRLNGPEIVEFDQNRSASNSGVPVSWLES